MQQQPAPPVDQHVPNIARNRGELYPRWWILSAFLLSLCVILLICFRPFLPCSSGSSLCRITSWHPLLQVSLVWFVFIIIWFLVFIFFAGSIEVSKRSPTRTAQLFRALSEFGPLHLLLMLYGIIAVGFLVAMWMLDRTTPLAFTFASIVVFTANASLFRRRSSPQRRNYLIGYGVLALIALVFTLLYRQNQNSTPFILAELLLIGIGVWAIFRRPRPGQQLSAQEQLDANISRGTSPLFILRSTWPFNRLIPNRPTI